MFARRLKCLALFTTFVFLFCEWLIYYIVLYQCSWPELSPERQQESQHALRVMMLADPHLLGPLDGHWFDKLRREWQMERAFQTALTLFNPDVVFVVGDLFDEGMKCSNEEFQRYLERFKRMFWHPEGMQFHVVFGNHDIGFHDKASADITLYQRFADAFKVPPAELLQIKGNVFVVVNSIGLEGDTCLMCNETRAEINKIVSKLNCDRSQENKNFRHDQDKVEKAEECEVSQDSPAPILIQHFPLYRPNEAQCTGPDAPPLSERTENNRPKWEVVSQEASEFLLTSLQPRLAISGHTHHGCYLVHPDGTPELTIPSFSWRNRNNPSFVLAIFTPKYHALSKCFMPEEYTVIAIYIFSGILLVLMNVAFAVGGLKAMHRKFRRQLYRDELQGVATRY